MAATSSTMAMLDAKFLISASANAKVIKPIPTKPISLLSIQNLPKGLTTVQPPQTAATPLQTVVGGAIFFQPAVDQINRMRTKGVVVGLGIGGGVAAASGLFTAPEATAGEIAAIAEAAAAAASDNRGQLLLIVITPAILWVLYNILQPALNQINKMRS